MIYIKDGKLLVAANGKLCKTCCCGCELTNDCPVCFNENETPSQYQVTFAGIRWCSDDSLITELNTVHCLPFDTFDVGCWWQKTITLNEENYVIEHQLNPGVASLMQVYRIPLATGNRIFYDSVAYTTGNINYTNDWVIGNCGVGAPRVIVAYGGTGTLVNVCP